MIGEIIYSWLHEGEENAITQAKLARITGYKQREIRKAVSRLRESGKVIVASNTGYYLPTDDDCGEATVRRFIAMMEAQAKSRFLSVQSAKRWLAEHRQETLI